MILLGTKGPENSKLYWQTDKTQLDKGLLYSLWSILKVQTSQLLLVLTLPIHMASSLVVGAAAAVPSASIAGCGHSAWGISARILGNCCGPRGSKSSFRDASLLRHHPRADALPHILQKQCRIGMLTVRSEGPARLASLRLNFLVCKIRWLVAFPSRSYCEDHTR